MEGFKTYKVKGSNKGISDLKSIYAFHGNSQGDESRTNDVERFKNSEGWLSVSTYFKDIDYLNQEEVNKLSFEIEKENDKYIESLHKSGEYGDYNGDIELSIKENPMYDSPRRPGKSLESYRMTFIDFSKK